MIEFETVQVNLQGEVVLRETRQCQVQPYNLGGGIALEMVRIPAGIFSMGSPGQSGYEDERPQHHVRIGEFWISRCPLTQQQWAAVMHRQPTCRTTGLQRPVDRVSWKDASEFCAKLARKTAQPFRLPTEAEWEYACRAGTHTPFHFGPTLTTDLANYVGEYIFQQEARGIYRHGSTDVGSFPPNAFGLHDMHGNVWEWCADDWHDDYSGAPSDGSLWMNRGEPGFKVLRGGSWHEPPINCRSATRLKMQMNESEDFFSFRVALTLQ